MSRGCPAHSRETLGVSGTPDIRTTPSLRFLTARDSSSPHSRRVPRGPVGSSAEEGHEFKNQLGNKCLFPDVKSLVHVVWSRPTAPSGGVSRSGVPGLGTDIAVLSSSGVLLQTTFEFQGRGPQRPHCEISEAMGLASRPANNRETDSHRRCPISASRAAVGDGGLGTRCLAVTLGVDLGHDTSRGLPAHLVTEEKGLGKARSPPEPATSLGKGPRA